MPGLLQTTEYARNMFANLMRCRPELTDIDEAVAGRLRRQEVLYEPGKTFEFLVTESALSAILCPLGCSARSSRSSSCSVAWTPSSWP